MKQIFKSKICNFTVSLFFRTVIYFPIRKLLINIKTKNNLLKESQICMYVFEITI